MNSRQQMLGCFGVIALLVISFVLRAQENQTGLSLSEDSQTTEDLKLDLPKIKEALTNKNAGATAVLVEALRALVKTHANKRFFCTAGRPGPDSQVNPLSYPRILFENVLSELLTRKGKPVVSVMAELLLSEELDENDRRRIWSELRQMSEEDVPVVLEATDPSQRRSYLLRITTDSKTEIEVKKADTLLRIAKKAYPNLSRWSGVEIISFMNGLESEDRIKVGRKLRIYPYQILMDNPAIETEDHSAKTDK